MAGLRQLPTQLETKQQDIPLQSTTVRLPPTNANQQTHRQQYAYVHLKRRQMGNT